MITLHAAKPSQTVSIDFSETAPKKKFSCREKKRRRLSTKLFCFLRSDIDVSRRRIKTTSSAVNGKTPGGTVPVKHDEIPATIDFESLEHYSLLLIILY